ncbi:hypothetical protein [Clostridium psychrophilum]|uniref:hypothetical protein n=1 Tax=Clostridium psychrophilum TaxID=132926 RepID=UPI001C0CE356|nr:hypothetical protein [Clostridium psychrophilum]MBU3183101.1 hypothetical protein [Clostridium psychrophilum]
MVIDNEREFDTDKDELIWTKIITIFPLTANNKSTHLVKYYKTGLMKNIMCLSML